MKSGSKKITPLHGKRVYLAGTCIFLRIILTLQFTFLLFAQSCKILVSRWSVNGEQETLFFVPRRPRWKPHVYKQSQSAINPSNFGGFPRPSPPLLENTTKKNNKTRERKERNLKKKTEGGLALAPFPFPRGPCFTTALSSVPRRAATPLYNKGALLSLLELFLVLGALAQHCQFFTVAWRFLHLLHTFFYYYYNSD